MVTIKNKDEIKILQKGGKILAKILKRLISEVKPGTTTGQLEQLALELIAKAGGRPSFKGYKSRHDIKAYPTALCTSINHEVVHAPSLPSRRLKNGDIIGIDVGMEYPLYPPGTSIKRVKPYNQYSKQGGFYTDIAATVAVGKIDKNVGKLLAVTRDSLTRAISAVKPGNTLNDIGQAVQTYVEANGLSVVRDLVGHGVGYDVHEDPHVPNYAIDTDEFDNIVLTPGMVIAIEPMVNIGGYEVTGAADGFTIKTADGSLSAHFEHTVAVTEKGCAVLTAL